MTPYSEAGDFSPREPPHSDEVERAILGAILIDNRLLTGIDLVPEDFYSDRHRVIFKAIRGLDRNNSGIDLLTLESRLKEQGDLVDVGGTAYLASLDVNLPSLGGIGDYVEILKNHSRRRDVQNLAGDLYRAACQQDVELDAPLEDARRGLESLAISGTTEHLTAYDLGDLMFADYERRKRLKGGGVPTGIPELDDLLGGLHAGTIALGAAPGEGKTTLARQIAVNVAEFGVPVFYLTYENPAISLLEQMVCAKAGIAPRDAYLGRLDEGQEELLFSTFNEMAHTLKTIRLQDGSPTWTVSRVSAITKRLMEETGEDQALVVVDYLQKMAGQCREYSGLPDERSRINRLMGGLSLLSRNLNSPVLVITSLKRDSGYARGKSTYSLDAAKGSGDIEYDAPVLLFLGPGEDVGDDEKYQKYREREVAEVRLSAPKVRFGSPGSIDLTFDKKHSKFKTGSMRAAEVAAALGHQERPL